MAERNAYIVNADGLVVNIAIEDDSAPIAADDGFTIARGIDGGNIGDYYNADTGEFTPAPIAPPEPDPLADWSRRLDGARSIAQVKAVLSEHPALGYVPAGEPADNPNTEN